MAENYKKKNQLYFKMKGGTTDMKEDSPPKTMPTQAHRRQYLATKNKAKTKESRRNQQVNVDASNDQWHKQGGQGD
jgi:hypothetical protein